MATNTLNHRLHQIINVTSGDKVDNTTEQLDLENIGCGR